MPNLFRHLAGSETKAHFGSKKTLKAEKADGIYAGKREPKSRQRSEVMTGASAKRFQERVQGDRKPNNIKKILPNSSGNAFSITVN